MSGKIALYHADQAYTEALIEQFKAYLPNREVVIWEAGMAADYLLAWKPDKQLFATRGLKVIFALGAGVDAFLTADLPAGVPLVRLQEAGMGAQMLEIALYGILHYSRDMIALRQAQQQKQWLAQATPKKMPFSAKVGVMGLGQLGGYVATKLAALGYTVSGYSRTLKDLPGIDCYDQSRFADFLGASEVLINLLPLTPATENCLNQTTFSQLPKGAYLINIARGKHLVEADLIPALDSGQLSGALLDVFRSEPLPPSHPFWADHRIIVLPHLAAITLQSHAVQQIGDNILRFEAQKPMSGVIDFQSGY